MHNREFNQVELCGLSIVNLKLFATHTHQLFVCRSCHEYSKKMVEHIADTCPFPPKLELLSASSSFPRTPEPNLHRLISAVAYRLHSAKQLPYCWVYEKKELFRTEILWWGIYMIYTCVRGVRKQFLCDHQHPIRELSCQKNRWTAAEVREPNATNESNLKDYKIQI